MYGKLDGRYAELIPKALGLKTLGDITTFVNDFLLPEDPVDFESLGQNIAALKELQVELADMEKRKQQLNLIQEAYRKYCSYVDERETNVVLAEFIQKALFEEKKDKKEREEKELRQKLEQLKAEEANAKKSCDFAENQLRELIIVRDSNNSSRLIQSLEETLKNERVDERRLSENVMRLIKSTEAIDAMLASAYFREKFAIENASCLLSQTEGFDAKNAVLTEIENTTRALEDVFNKKTANLANEISEKRREIEALSAKISELKANKRDYPNGVNALKHEIEKEFQKNNIESNVYVFADRLEIVPGMEDWQNAVEGFLGNRRFNIIVEPKYYDMALSVYARCKDEISDVALVNTKKLKLDRQVDKNSLAAVVHSNNRYVAAYAEFLMGKVIRCNTVYELENYDAAITDSCMLYSQLTVKKINKNAYKTPHIGKDAIERQIAQRVEELGSLQFEKAKLDKRCSETESALRLLRNCHFDIAREYLTKPNELFECQNNIKCHEKELDEAKNDPTIAEIQTKIKKAEDNLAKCREKRDFTLESKAVTERDISNCLTSILSFADDIAAKEATLADIKQSSGEYYDKGEERFKQECLNKNEFSTILKKIESRKGYLDKNVNSTRDILAGYQLQYRGGEYGSGPDAMVAFDKEWKMLSDANIADKKDDIKAFETKNIIQFRESFLCKMREKIENAKKMFASLNKKMDGIYYGNDSYHFKVEGNKNKLALYKMITSDLNADVDSLFTSTLDEDYHDEMEELFDKIKVSNDAEMNVAREYADYRSYLQYDIVIKNKEGGVKLLSKNSGHTSGGETQTPCYVALAASFSQAYDVVGGEPIGLMLIDEAFNKMDHNRASSLMTFLISQNFQLIIASPPDKTSLLIDFVDRIDFVTKDCDGGVSTVLELEKDELQYDSEDHTEQVG